MALPFLSHITKGVTVMAREFAKRFYKSQAWKKCRDGYAQSVGYLCEDCLAKGIYTPGIIVHHIEELTPLNIENPEVTLNYQNLKLVCRECHALEHEQMYQARRRKRRYNIDADGRVHIISD